MTIPARTAFRSAILAEAAIWPAALIVALLHLVPTQLSPVTDMVSEYALGRFGLLADTCFLAIGGSALALAVCLRRALQPTPAVKTATIALTVMATATFALPFFPTDPDRPSTVHGWIHLTAALLGMTSLIVAAAAIAVHYRTHVATPPAVNAHRPSQPHVLRCHGSEPGPHAGTLAARTYRTPADSRRNGVDRRHLAIPAHQDAGRGLS